VEHTHSWMNGYGKNRRCTEKRRSTIEFYPHLAATLTVIRPHQRRPHRLPLTNPTHHPKTQVTTNCRTF